MGACLNARIPRVVFATREPKCGACGSVVDLSSPPGYNHSIHVRHGLPGRSGGAADKLLKNYDNSGKQRARRDLGQASADLALKRPSTATCSLSVARGA